MCIDKTQSRLKALTCLGTALASRMGMLFGVVMASNWLITDPDKTLTKNIFQMVNEITLKHALFFLPLREIHPSIAENSIIVGGTI